jgi:hypothetical protein
MTLPLQIVLVEMLSHGMGQTLLWILPATTALLSHANIAHHMADATVSVQTLACLRRCLHACSGSGKLLGNITLDINATNLPDASNFTVLPRPVIHKGILYCIVTGLVVSQHPTRIPHTCTSYMYYM